MGNSGIKKRLDYLWSALIRNRARDCCEKCGAYGVQAHHIYSRRIECIRWSLLNGIALCPRCHTQSSVFSAHLTPDLFMEWLEQDRPQELEELRDIKRLNEKLYLGDLELLEKKFKIIHNTPCF